MSARQVALALSTKNLSTAELEEIVRVNNLIEKYGAEELIKVGLLSANSALLASEKTLSIKRAEELLQLAGIQEKQARILISKHLSAVADGEEATTKQVLIKELLDEAVAKELITSQNAKEILSSEGVIINDTKEIASKEALIEALKQERMARVSLINILSVGAIAFGVASIAIAQKTKESIEEVRDRAKELSDTFDNSKSSVDDYKSQIDDLYNTIKDSGSSVAEVTTARQTLMTVQDELIEKFGDEKETINLITQAINGQSTALDELTQKQWQAAKNDFNKSNWLNDFGNWQDGYSDNIDRMVNEMENAHSGIRLSTSDYFNGEYDDIIKRLEEAGWVYSSAYETFTKGGSVEDLYEEILDIQTLAGNDMPDNFLNSLTEDANTLKSTLDSYEGMWNNYILNDKIFTDNNLAESWKEINNAYSTYQETFVNGDEEAKNKAIENYADILTKATEGVDDQSAVDFFNDMYPDLQEEVEKWTFKTKIIPEFHNIELLQGKTQEDIREMLQTNDFQSGEGVFRAILKSASEYGLVIGEDSEKVEQLLDFLVEWGILQGDITDKASNTATSFSDIFALEDAKGELTTLGNLNEQVDNLQKAYTGLKSAMDSYNKSGYFTLDQVQEILSYGDGYLQYLMDENGNLQLNEEALNKLMVARINEMRVKALSDLYNQVSSIKDEEDALKFLEGRLTDVTEATNEYNEAKFQSLLLSKRELMSDEAYAKFESSVIKMVNTTNALFDNIDVGSFSGNINKETEEAAKAAKEKLESTLAVYEAELNAGIIDLKTYLNKCNALLDDARDKAIITTKEYWDYQKEKLETQLEVKICLAS